jgi:glyoxylase-like metal-dependent hydrolase (beta-lactamase superfamily II)
MPAHPDSTPDQTINKRREKMRNLLKNVTILALLLVLPVGNALAQDDMFAPVPETAIGPVIDQEVGYLVEELGSGLYLVSDGSYQMMFLTTGEGVIAVDAPPSTGANILEAIASVTDEPITHVIYSHSHIDHIGAASVYPDDAVIIAQDATTAHLAAKNDPNRPVPTQSFTDSLTLRVGTQTLQLDYRGLGHSPGNIHIYAPEQKVLMVVDIVFPGWVPFKDLAVAESIGGFVEAHNLILNYDFDHYVGGHRSTTEAPAGTRAHVETQQAYLADVFEAGARANAAMDFGSAFGAAAARGGQANLYAITSILLDSIAQQCADEVEEKWRGRLGGVDIFTFGHCMRVTLHQRID